MASDCAIAIQADPEDRAIVVTFRNGRLQGHAAEAFFGTDHFDLIGVPLRDETRVDLSEVDYVSSGVLGKLVALDRRLRGLGRRLTLWNPRSRVREVLHCTRLDRLFHICVGNAKSEAPLDHEASD